MLDSAKIGSFMKDLMTEYDRLRGRDPREVGASFWDVVVISAGDEEQRAWYEAQLDLKREAGELPLVTILVIPDPPAQGLAPAARPFTSSAASRQDTGPIWTN